jgi:hypothetical protein
VIDSRTCPLLDLHYIERSVDALDIKFARHDLERWIEAEMLKSMLEKLMPAPEGASVSFSWKTKYALISGRSVEKAKFEVDRQLLSQSSRVTFCLSFYTPAEERRP